MCIYNVYIHLCVRIYTFRLYSKIYSKKGPYKYLERECRKRVHRSKCIFLLKGLKSEMFLFI